MYAPQTPVRLGGLCLNIKLFTLPWLQGRSRGKRFEVFVEPSLALFTDLWGQRCLSSAAHLPFREKRRHRISGFCTPFPLGGTCPLFCTSRYLQPPGGDVTGMCSASLLAAWKGFRVGHGARAPFPEPGSLPSLSLCGGFRWVSLAGNSHVSRGLRSPPCASRDHHGAYTPQCTQEPRSPISRVFSGFLLNFAEEQAPACPRSLRPPCSSH